MAAWRALAGWAVVGRAGTAVGAAALVCASLLVRFAIETEGVLTILVGIIRLVVDARVGVGAISKGGAGVGVGGAKAPGTQATLKRPMPTSAATAFNARVVRRPLANAVDLVNERLPVNGISTNHSQSEVCLQATK